MHGDVRSRKQMSEIIADFRPDLIIHLAAQRNPALAERRVTETVSTNVLDRRSSSRQRARLGSAR